MTLSITATSLPPLVIYSIPRRVDTMTLMREVTAWRSDLFLMLSISMMKSKLSFCVILKMSRLISSSTKVLRSSGAICKALTLSESNISMMP